MSIYFILTFLSMIVESFAGFGGSAIAMPFVALANGTSNAVVLLSFNSLVEGMILLVSQYKRIVWKEYAKLTLTIAAIMPVGFLLFSKLSPYDATLKLLFGVIISIVAACFLYKIYIKHGEHAESGKVVQTLSLVSGSVFHGMFSTGGPILAVYLSGKISDRSEFRATLTAVWVTLNIVSTVVRWKLMNMYTVEVLLMGVKGIPFLLGGMCIGMYLHKLVDNRLFIRAIYFVMFACGLMSIVNSLIVMF